MKIIITGGLGFIGSHITRKLIENNYEVIIIDNMSSNIVESISGCQHLNYDLNDYDTLKEVKIPKVNTLLHLAGQASGPTSFQIPEIDIKNNILATLNLIKWCKINNIKRVIFASSSMVYGDNPDNECLNEDNICYPKTIYASSKYYAENLFKIYATPLGIKWNILRMYNVYGPGQDLTRMDQGMVSIFLSIVKQGNYVGVKGPLNRFRDFIYIDDIVQGWECCLMDNNHLNQIYNLGTGVKTYISSLIEIIVDVYGKTGKVKIEEVGATPGDILGSYADISKISNDLNFKPTISLEQGVQLFKDWSEIVE